MGFVARFSSFLAYVEVPSVVRERETSNPESV